MFSELNEVKLALLLKALPYPADLLLLHEHTAVQDEYEMLRQWHLPFFCYLDGLELEERNRIAAFSQKLEIIIED